MIPARRGGGSSNRSWWVVTQPAAKPPAVTKVAWARLTMPPMPVTTTKDNMTIGEGDARAPGWPRS